MHILASYFFVGVRIRQRSFNRLLFLFSAIIAPRIQQDIEPLILSGLISSSIVPELQYRYTNLVLVSSLVAHEVHLRLITWN